MAHYECKQCGVVGCDGDCEPSETVPPCYLNFRNPIGRYGELLHQTRCEECRVAKACERGTGRAKDAEAPVDDDYLPKAFGAQVGGSHYKDLAIQPVEYIHRNGIGFCEGSVVKYVTRWRAKGGVEDLKKARHFLDLLIDMETNNE